MYLVIKTFVSFEINFFLFLLFAMLVTAVYWLIMFGLNCNYVVAIL